ncbi:sugar ABC transporter permease [Paenibacillus sp. MER TA 81-3]|uniref:carbohydrate ABC transporter permease n=1 Tax=Paenibacillus sp. MER TA 81-3 TaxID=2939573 RepID=UPI00203E246C|nr:sugar ABC transporter permease [Paenibacillus sp. MER TA 81-3]MCM3339859.1 sugar ABC transporter permease [Paenibacillus sp. MER TA 81-3]
MADMVSLSSKPRPGNRRKRKALLPWLYVLPALLLTGFVIAIPTVGTLYISLTNWDGIRPPEFIGLQNFATLIQDVQFYKALKNNLIWLLLFCTIPVSFSLIVAVLLSRVRRGQMFYRVTFFLPYICSTVVTAKIWSWIYNPFFGINKVLEGWGFTNLPLWLGDPDKALFSVAFVDGWRYWGFLLILFLTGFHQTDRSLEEAAMIDGAGKIRIFWSVIIPQLRPTLLLIMMMTMIWSFAAFDYVYVMTGGGPGNATELIATYMYKEALQNQAPGYASSIALALALFSGIVIAVFGYLRKRGWEI